MLGKAIVVLVLAVIMVPPLRTLLWYMDWYAHSHKHYPGNCRHVKASGIGSEDFQILSNGLTFISTGVFVTVSYPEFKAYVKSKGKGSIQMINLNIDTSATEVLPIKHGKDFDPDAFRPHGLDVIEDKLKGEHLIYTINHVENDADRVEKFRFIPQTKELQHEKSIFSDEFHMLNDLSLLSEDTFYVTDNFYFNTSHTMALIENLYMLNLASVLFYDGTKVTKVVGGLFSPNGIQVSRQKRHVYVSMLNTKLVHVYQRQQADNSLVLEQEINIHTGLDNFHLSEDGMSLWGGCHPVFYKCISHLSDPAKEKAPSQVIRMPLKDGLIQEKEIIEEFYDQGDLVSGSSVAGAYKNKLLIGSVVDTLVMCHLPDQS